MLIICGWMRIGLELVSWQGRMGGFRGELIRSICALARWIVRLHRFKSISILADTSSLAVKVGSISMPTDQIIHRKKFIKKEILKSVVYRWTIVRTKSLTEHHTAIKHKAAHPGYTFISENCCDGGFHDYHHRPPSLSSVTHPPSCECLPPHYLPCRPSLQM